MKNVYCTLFNYSYLAKGLCLYQSMERCIDHFRLYILAMDSGTKAVLDDLHLEGVSVVYYEDLMDEKLRTVLENRMGPSFFWTFTPIIVEYILTKKQEEWCTYIDADCYFFKNPERIFDIIEKGCYSVGVVEHRFRKDEGYDKWVALDGRFNVAFNTFRNDNNSLGILLDWKKQCLQCCSDKPGEGVFGDQLYLNEWPDKYKGVYIVEDDGIDVAPWNVNNYIVSRENGTYRISCDKESYEVSMYHFHAISFLSNKLVSLNLWNTRPRWKSKVLFEMYKEYVIEYRKQKKIADRYFHIDLERTSLFGKINGLVLKFSERREKSIISIIRNIIII